MPDFYGWVHEFVGKALNTHYDRGENFWATESTSCVRLVESGDVVAKTVYTLANPVSAGLVSHGTQWPGLRLYQPQARRIERPTGFFRPNGPTPATVELEIAAPPVGADSTDAAIGLIEQAVEAKEAQVRAEFRTKRRKFLGKRAILAQRPADSPSTRALRRGLSPRIACRNKWLRIAMLQTCKQFVAAYRAAWQRWCAGVRDVVFPAGTFQMVRTHGVLVADP